MTATFTSRHTHETSREDLVARVRTGVVAGLGAGVVFVVLAMLHGLIVGPGLWAPPRMIATILGFEMNPAFAVVPVVLGLVLHMVLSGLYGGAFAAVSGRLRGMVLLAAGAVFGLALYLVNFHVMTQVEQFAAFRMMTGNSFEIAIHVVYGLLVAAGLMAWHSRSRSR